MMFKHNFVATIKCGGKILREKDGEVFLPFGAEYSILLKNLDTRRAVVRISIDGTDVLCGETLVVNGGSDLELERFLDTLTKGNRFRFIEKTEQISEHRGDHVDDGIVRIEYQFEAQRLSLVELATSPGSNPYSWPTTTPQAPQAPQAPSCPRYAPGLGDVLYTVSTDQPLISCCFTAQTAMRSAAPIAPIAPATTDGITVKGSVSTQHFTTVQMGPLDPATHVLSLGLVGQVAAAAVVQPVTVQTKLICTTCGHSTNSRASYCPDCGTALACAITR